ncbi:hypothetical protein CEXT_573601 [Caerostris extrusa]|uniref:Uncharacterized protein n=1 Tax=Caerostris extrusa TaxID=172846 RepID=A0AAV4SEA4_CAEEX|nr:hypothetical protein CEXT_573601 [Caerostris extrusa]
MSWPSLTLLYLHLATHFPPVLCTSISVRSFTLAAGNNPGLIHTQKMQKFLQACVLKDNGGNVPNVKCQGMLRKVTVEDISRCLVSEPITAQGQESDRTYHSKRLPCTVGGINNGSLQIVG